MFSRQICSHMRSVSSILVVSLHRVYYLFSSAGWSALPGLRRSLDVKGSAIRHRGEWPLIKSADNSNAASPS